MYPGDWTEANLNMLNLVHIKAVIVGVIICCTQAFQISRSRSSSEFCRAVSVSSSNNVGAKRTPFNVVTTTSFKPTFKSVDTQHTHKIYKSSESLAAASISSGIKLGSKSFQFNVLSTIPAKQELGFLDSQNFHDEFVEAIPSSSSLSIVYNASDISSYFMRNPSLVIGRVMQVIAEVATILVAAMEGAFQEGTDNGSVATPALRKGRVKLAAAVRDSMIRMVRADWI